MIKTIRKPKNNRVKWAKVIDKVNQGKTVRVPMGSPGSAQVTRVRVLGEYTNLEGWTQGSDVFLRLR